jgi:hypothetical protein
MMNYVTHSGDNTMTTFNLNTTPTIATLVDGSVAKRAYIVEDDNAYDLYVDDEFICCIRGETVTVNYYNKYSISIHTDNGGEVSIELDHTNVITTITI